MNNGRESGIDRRHGISPGSADLGTNNEDDLLPEVAVRKALGLDVNAVLPPEEQARLSRLREGLRLHMGALLKGVRVAPPAMMRETPVLSEKTESPDHNLLDFLHLPDTIPVREMIIMMARPGIPANELDIFFASRRYEQLKGVFFDIVKKSKSEIMGALKNSAPYRSQIVLLWNFAHLCVAELLGERESALEHFKTYCAELRAERHRVNVGHVFDDDDYESYSELETFATSRDVEIGAKEYLLDRQFPIDSCLRSIGSAGETSPFREKVRQAKLSDATLKSLRSLLRPQRLVMMPTPMVVHRQMAFKDYHIDVRRASLSLEERKLLSDETDIGVDPDLQPKTVDFVREKLSAQGISLDDLYGPMLAHFVNGSSFYRFVHAMADRMPGEDKKVKISQVCDAVDEQMLALQLLVINASKLRLHDRFPAAKHAEVVATAFSNHWHPSMEHALMQANCHINDHGVIVTDEGGPITEFVEKVVVGWRKANDYQREAKAKEEGAHREALEALVAQKALEDKEFTEAVTVCERKFAEVNQYFIEKLAPQLVELTLALANVKIAKDAFTNNIATTLAYIDEVIDDIRRSKIFAVVKWSAAGKKIAQLRAQGVLLEALAADEGCQFSSESVGPLAAIEVDGPVDSVKETSIRSKIAAAEQIVADRESASKLRLTVCGDVLPHFVQLLKEFSGLSEKARALSKARRNKYQEVYKEWDPLNDQVTTIESNLENDSSWKELIELYARAGEKANLTTVITAGILATRSSRGFRPKLGEDLQDIAVTQLRLAMSTLPPNKYPFLLRSEDTGYWQPNQESMAEMLNTVDTI